MCFLIAGGNTEWTPRQWEAKRYPQYVSPYAVIKKRRDFGTTTCDSERCGKSFERSNKKQRFCSAACRWVSRQRKIVHGLLQCSGPCGRQLPASTEHFRRDRTSVVGFTSSCTQCLNEAYAKRRGRIGPMGVNSPFVRGAIWETNHNGVRATWKLGALSVYAKAGLLAYRIVDGKRAKRPNTLRPSWVKKYGREVVAGEAAAE